MTQPNSKELILFIIVPFVLFTGCATNSEYIGTSNKYEFTQTGIQANFIPLYADLPRFPPTSDVLLTEYGLLRDYFVMGQIKIICEDPKLAVKELLNKEQMRKKAQEIGANAVIFIKVNFVNMPYSRTTLQVIEGTAVKYK